MPTIEARRTTSGSRERVWELLADAPAWARWGSWSSVEVEGGGPQGPGSIRVLEQRPYRLRERVTEWEPLERFGYELVDGMKAEGYRSTITLSDAPGGGTGIHWRSTYESAGPLTAIVLRLAVREACRRLARAAASP